MQKTLYITSNGRLRRKDNTLYFETENEKRSTDIENVEQIHIFGEVDLNTKALNYISQYGIILHFYNYYGFYAGNFMPRKKTFLEMLLFGRHFIILIEKREFSWHTVLSNQRFII